jgi:large subunit ribosomal protein L32e
MNTKKIPSFHRTDYMRSSKLGKNRKKLHKWRAAKGKHSKIRRQRRNYPKMPTVGYMAEKTQAGKIEGLIPLRVENLAQLSKATKENIIIIARVGAKKKMDLIKKADEMKLKIANLGSKK